MRKRIFVIFYTAIVVSSVLYLTAASINYLQFYPALQSLRADAAGQQIIRDTQNNPAQILLRLSISNPTEYSGLRLEYVGLRLYFTAGNHSIFQGFQLLGENSTRAELGPRTSLLLEARFPLMGNQSSILGSFLNTYGATVVSRYNVDIHLFTFLDALAPRLDVVRDVQYSNG